MDHKQTLKYQNSNYSSASLERMPRDWTKLCLIVKLPYCQHRINYKISHRTISKKPFRRACLISGCAQARFHCRMKNMLIFQQPVPIKAIFTRIGGIQSFWPRHMSSMMYKGPIAVWRAMATPKQPQKM